MESPKPEQVADPMALKVAQKEVAASRRQGGRVRALLTPASVGATSGFLGTVDLAPGESVSEHYHPYSDKFFYVLEGTVDFRLNGKTVRVEASESLMVRRGTRHQLDHAGGGQARLVFTIAPLAPRPELGHVDTAPPPHPEAEVPRVG
ncbi:cupin domain-containing protein [Nocardiopsis halophila]|uniref:cupin domain-containing protein n=1 Tax=Nocardiopsis halophila TaxID=141692 RepID=UPI000346E746|nr:cupin domain-containing protein [Nocardiopsis halophila]